MGTRTNTTPIPFIKPPAPVPIPPFFQMAKYAANVDGRQTVLLVAALDPQRPGETQRYLMHEREHPAAYVGAIGSLSRFLSASGLLHVPYSRGFEGYFACQMPSCLRYDHRCVLGGAIYRDGIAAWFNGPGGGDIFVSETPNKL